MTLREQSPSMTCGKHYNGLIDKIVWIALIIFLFVFCFLDVNGENGALTGDFIFYFKIVPCRHPPPPQKKGGKDNERKKRQEG